MVEIIESSKERVYKKVCKCGCRFSYLLEDLTIMENGYDAIISCPECNSNHRHETNI